VGETTPLVSRLKPREPYLTHSSVVVISIFVILVSLSGLCGAWIRGSICTGDSDILDAKIRNQIRRDWSIELENHKAEERKWQEKKERRECEEDEKRGHGRMRMYWDDIRPGEHCIAYRTMKYTARLVNLLPGPNIESIDAIEACEATPLTIHNVTYDSPIHCELSVSPCLVSNQYYAVVLKSILIRHIPDATMSMGIGWFTMSQSVQRIGNPSKIMLVNPLYSYSWFTLTFIAVLSGLHCTKVRFTGMSCILVPFGSIRHTYTKLILSSVSCCSLVAYDLAMMAYKCPSAHQRLSTGKGSMGP
jgi:hypothetical protein